LLATPEKVKDKLTALKNFKNNLVMFITIFLKLYILLTKFLKEQ